jgi:hypothetical protein
MKTISINLTKQFCVTVHDNPRADPQVIVNKKTSLLTYTNKIFYFFIISIMVIR